MCIRARLEVPYLEIWRPIEKEYGRTTTVLWYQMRITTKIKHSKLPHSSLWAEPTPEDGVACRTGIRSAVVDLDTWAAGAKGPSNFCSIITLVVSAGHRSMSVQMVACFAK